ALPEAQAQGLTASAFSFNSGSGRCERCNGTGFEKIEMQFLSDLYVRCAECEGKRFQPHVLKIQLRGKSIHDVLELTVTEAAAWFAQIGEREKLSDPLEILEEVGLGYLRLGQPLNTLSGGESQRLKLVSHLADKSVSPAKKNDAAGTATGSFLRAVIPSPVEGSRRESFKVTPQAPSTPLRYAQDDGGDISLRAAEEPFNRMPTGLDKMSALPARNANGAIQVHGAREHNLKNIDVAIPRDQMVVITGLSGSGKSTLAFDILFAEGQRRFLDSMSPYARQFVEQLEKPDVDLVEGLPPSVAIEQRVKPGGGNATVGASPE